LLAIIIVDIPVEFCEEGKCKMDPSAEEALSPHKVAPKVLSVSVRTLYRMHQSELQKFKYD
jgi:hypothetical protein